MENTTKKKSVSLLKYLAVIAFIGVVILLSWFSIQLVNNMPGAFSSLASLAESIKQNPSSYNESETSELEDGLITVTSNKNLLNSGDLVDISWSTTKTPGSYTFYYECDSGIAMDIINQDLDSRIIGCGKNYNVGNTDSLTLHVESEKVRFEDINYTIAFLSTNDSTPRASGTASFTVVNSSIPDEFTNLLKTEASQNQETEVINENKEVEAKKEIASETEEMAQVEEEEKTVSEETIINTPPTEEAPSYVQEFTYEVPTSDPNGKTDLSTKFIATGNLLSNIFIPGYVHEEKDGAIQFEVKNYGTKTSEKWTFSISLPNEIKYVSDEQEPLKPNERAVLTIGFTASEKSQHTFVVEVEEPTDKNSANDSFNKTIYFTD